MRIGAGVSTSPDARAAALHAALEARRPLGDEPVDLAVLVASTHHREWAAALLDALHEAVAPARAIGCVAEAVVAGDREIEGEPAVSVWLASLPEGVETFHMEFARTESGGLLAGWRFEPDEGHQTGAPVPLHLLICDPFTFPADALLAHLNERVPGALVVGGMASGATRAGETVLFLDRDVRHDGAVGARLGGSVLVRTLVSQGCRPIGNPFAVTRAERNVLFELGGRPPLERLREAVATLSGPDRQLVSTGLHIGRAIDEYKAEPGLGDYLVRGVLGVDPHTGAMAVGDRLQVGETVVFHVRDEAAADEELRSLLDREVPALPGPPAGALLFTCNGRGSRMFSTPDHDARLVSRVLGGVPMAGFFCAGEIGPVGGKNFVHGFTASLAVFVESFRFGSTGRPAPPG